MDQLRSFGDERVLEFCAFCGGETGTRDHCPSRVLLDEPYPEHLPVVPACSACNASFSTDEEYFACLIACAKAGTTDPERLQRSKVRRILTARPALRAKLEQARHTANDVTAFRIEQQRVENVFVKFARGHALHELHEPMLARPDAVRVKLLTTMTKSERAEFENPAPPTIWPEVGSRAMQRLSVGSGAVRAPWIEVQAGRYRFHASPANGITIRMVVNEYLAGQVIWAY
jgi:hypothetical protein